MPPADVYREAGSGALQAGNNSSILGCPFPANLWYGIEWFGALTRIMQLSLQAGLHNLSVYK